MEPAAEVAVITIMILGTGIVLQQDAAVGAAFGSAFFMISAKDHKTAIRFMYTLISAGAGYAAGLALAGPWSMLAAILGAAGAVAFLDGLTHGGEPSGFVKWVVDVMRGRK